MRVLEWREWSVWGWVCADRASDQLFKDCVCGRELELGDLGWGRWSVWGDVHLKESGHLWGSVSLGGTGFLEALYERGGGPEVLGGLCMEEWWFRGSGGAAYGEVVV